MDTRKRIPASEAIQDISNEFEQNYPGTKLHFRFGKLNSPEVYMELTWMDGPSYKKVETFVSKYDDVAIDWDCPPQPGPKLKQETYEGSGFTVDSIIGYRMMSKSVVEGISAKMIEVTGAKDAKDLEANFASYDKATIFEAFATPYSESLLPGQTFDDYMDWAMHYNDHLTSK